MIFSEEIYQCQAFLANFEPRSVVRWLCVNRENGVLLPPLLNWFIPEKHLSLGFTLENLMEAPDKERCLWPAWASDEATPRPERPVVNSWKVRIEVRLTKMSNFARSQHQCSRSPHLCFRTRRTPPVSRARGRWRRIAHTKGWLLS